MAPSPTGYLHLGHARTFWTAQERVDQRSGQLILRVEDLDQARCKPEFKEALVEDLRWFGLRWAEGPDIGGMHAPYEQSHRIANYISVFERLRDAGSVYPCTCSRQDVLRALSAPHEGEDEPIYPGTCRPEVHLYSQAAREGVNWRFRVRTGDVVTWMDGHFGPQQFVAGRDFGDFLIWRKDDIPSYQLAVVADDAAMQITEVVRGADLLSSTARQILLYRALNLPVPAFYHCPLVADEKGTRLAKRDRATSLRFLRSQGWSPADLRGSWNDSFLVASSHPRGTT